MFGIRRSPNTIRRVSMPVVAGTFMGVLALSISGCDFDAPIAADPVIVNPAEAEVEPSAFTAASGGLASQNWQLTDTELDHTTTLLEALPVKGRAPKTGYSRDQFGIAWTDDVDVELGHNGCDTRIICTQF